MAGDGDAYGAMFGAMPTPPVYQAFNAMAPSTAQTPEEQNIIDYTRQHYANGTYMRNPDGSITSFKGIIVGGEDGEPASIIPSYWDGRVVDAHTAMRNARAYVQKTGKHFPSYPSIAEAEAAEQRIHKTMSADVKFAPQDASPMPDPNLPFQYVLTPPSR